MRFLLALLLLIPTSASGAGIVHLSFDLEITNVDPLNHFVPPPPLGPGTGTVRLDLSDFPVTEAIGSETVWGGIGFEFGLKLDPAFAFDFESGFAGVDQCFPLNLACDTSVKYAAGTVRRGDVLSVVPLQPSAFSRPAAPATELRKERPRYP